MHGHRGKFTSSRSFRPMGLITDVKVLMCGGVAKINTIAVVVVIAMYRDTSRYRYRLSIIDIDAKSFLSAKVFLCIFSGTCAYVCDFLLDFQKELSNNKKMYRLHTAWPPVLLPHLSSSTMNTILNLPSQPVSHLFRSLV